MPWEERLAQAQTQVWGEQRSGGMFSLKWRQITLSGYLEGAAIAVENPYPLWLMRRITALTWGEGEARLRPTTRMGQVAEILAMADPRLDQTGQAAAVRFWLFCKIPHQVMLKQKGDAL